MIFSSDAQLDLLTRALILGPLGLFWVIAIVRVMGLRTFSKMTAFDLVSTVAIGSILANSAMATEWTTFVQGTISLLAILATQFVLATLRKNSDLAKEVLLNKPTLLAKDGCWIEAALTKTRVSKNDVWAKMREANITDISKLRAVVLETTGDISVLHGDELDPKILANVCQDCTDEQLSRM